jgi:hypothetical protein
MHAVIVIVLCVNEVPRVAICGNNFSLFCERAHGINDWLAVIFITIFIAPINVVVVFVVYN